MAIACGPYLQNVTQSSVTIMWHTDEPTASCVEYGPAQRIGWSAYDGRPDPVYTERVEDPHGRRWYQRG